MSETNETLSLAEKAWALREELSGVIFKRDGREPSEQEIRSVLCALGPVMGSCAMRLMMDKDGNVPLIPWEHKTPIDDHYWPRDLENPDRERVFTIRCVGTDGGAMEGHLEIGIPKVLLMESAYED